MWHLVFEISPSGGYLIVQLLLRNVNTNATDDILVQLKTKKRQCNKKLPQYINMICDNYTANKKFNRLSLCLLGF